jgi:GNAT superfamily N-acetyltransferase
MDNQIRIRKAGEKDLPALLELYRDLHDEDLPLPSPAAVNKVWEDMLGNPCIHCLLAERIDGLFISSCVLVIVPNLSRGARPYGLIENVVTRTDFRRQGHAAALLQQAIAIARSNNCYKVMLLSSKKREGAHMLYEKVGFERDSKFGFIIRIEENL